MIDSEPVAGVKFLLYADIIDLKVSVCICVACLSVHSVFICACITCMSVRV